MSRLVDDIKELIEDKERATLAALRRGLGKPPGSAGEMYPFVIPRLPESKGPEWTWEQQCHFIVAALFAWHQIDRPAPEPDGEGEAKRKPWNFGASVGALRRTDELRESDGPERRFVALLNAECEDLPDHLRSMVGILKAQDVPVDWEQLLCDLQKWGWSSRTTQTGWARSFWGAPPDTDEDGQSPDEPAQEESLPA